MTRPIARRRAELALQVLLWAFVLALGVWSVHARATWLHLKTGAWIAQNGRLPSVDPFSYVSAGARWRAPDWLADALLYRVFEYGGAAGVVALKALALAFAFAALLPLGGGDLMVSAGALAVAGCGAWPGFTELPQAFDFLFLALFLRWLSSARSFNAALAWRVAAASALWANLHPAGAWIGAALVAVQAFRRSLGAPGAEKLGWTGLVLAAAAAIFTNPHAAGAWGAWLAERPQWSVGSDLFGVYGVYLLGSVAAAWVCLQEDFFLAVGVMLLGALSLLQPAAAPLFLLAAAPLLARGLDHFIEPRELGVRSVALAAGGMALLLLSYAVQVTLPRGRLSGFSTRDTAEGAVQFLQANGVSGRMFNDLEVAPYLLWRAAPERLLFADERAGVHDAGLLDDARHWKERWGTLAGLYRFDYAVVGNEAAAGGSRGVAADPDWVLAYFDDASRVYRRKRGPNSRTPFYRHLRPGDWSEPVEERALADERGRKAALEETARAVLAAPSSAEAALIRSYALERSGDRVGADVARAEARRRGLWKPEHFALEARVLDLRGDWREALSALRRARVVAARAGDRSLESRLYAGAARVWRAHGDANRARRNLSRAVLLDPTNSDAEEMLRKL